MLKRIAKFFAVFGSATVFAGSVLSSQSLYRLAEQKRTMCDPIPRTVAEARQSILQLQTENNTHPAPQRSILIDAWN